MEVSLEKFNEAYLRIKCAPTVGRELSEFFTIEVPGAKFMPSVRKKYGMEKSDYIVSVLVKSTWDYYHMSKSFSKNKVIQFNTIRIFLKEIWINQLPPNLSVRLKREELKQETTK